MDRDLLAAAAIMARAEPLTMEALAAELFISRSTVHRRSGGMAALRLALVEQGVDGNPSTRERILETARRLVAIQGVARVSVESLAAEAGWGRDDPVRRHLPWPDGPGAGARQRRS